jgi:hypothetical protein
LLAQGAGLPRDLKAKLAVLPDNARPPDYLVVLWPRPAEGNLVDALPSATRKQWDTGTRPFGHADLRPLVDDDVRKLLALPEWMESIQNAVEVPVPADVLQAFLRQRCQGLLHVVLPPVAERSPRHAN